MPQTYMRTRPGSIGSNTSLRRVSVLWIRSMGTKSRVAGPAAPRTRIPRSGESPGPAPGRGRSRWQAARRWGIASGRSPLPAGAGLLGALWLLVLALPAAAQTLPPPQLEPPRAPDRSDPRLAATAVEQIQRLIREGS